jgi:hypothetical protein
LVYTHSGEQKLLSYSNLLRYSNYLAESLIHLLTFTNCLLSVASSFRSKSFRAVVETLLMLSSITQVPSLKIKAFEASQPFVLVKHCQLSAFTCILSLVSSLTRHTTKLEALAELHLNSQQFLSLLQKIMF